MSEKLCTLRTQGGGGGKYTETSLWTNPNPTSDFANQTVTLSESMDNFKYLKFVYKVYADAASNPTNEVIIPVEDFKTTNYTSGTVSLGLSSAANASGTNYLWSRVAYYASNTTITFSSTRATGANSTNNARSVPTEILGLNELDTSPITTNNIEIFPYASVAGGTTPTYQTKGRAVAIWQSFGRTDAVGFYTRTNVNPTTGEINNNAIYMSQNGATAWTLQSGASFTVTDTTITTTALSNNARLCSLGYTY